METTTCLVCGGYSGVHEPGCLKFELDRQRSLNAELASLVSELIEIVDTFQLRESKSYFSIERAQKILRDPEIAAHAELDALSEELIDTLSNLTRKSSEGTLESHSSDWVKAELLLERYFRFRSRS